MIDLTLLPTTLFAGQATELTVIARNSATAPCTTVRVELTPPRTVVPVGGSTRFKIPRLDPGASWYHRFTVEATKSGTFAVVVVKFVYRDGVGQRWRPLGLSLPLEVRPPEPVHRRPEFTSSEGRSPAARGLVFISYRWADSKHLADRLFENLRREFGTDRVYLDRQRQRLGQDFTQVVDTYLRASTVMLALIGPRWNPVADSGDHRRIDEDTDVVRHEIRTALRSGLPIIPVLFDGMRMPAAATLPEDIRGLTVRTVKELHDTGVDADNEHLLFALRPYVW